MKTFTELKKYSDVEWRDHAVTLVMHPTDMEDNTFGSALGKKFYGMNVENFETLEVKFKSMSEHTINGIHYDLEVQLYFRGVLENTDPGPR